LKGFSFLLEELTVDDVVVLKAMSGWSRVNTRLLMDSVGFKRTKFYNCVNKLIKLGLINRVLTGEYELTSQGRAIAERLVNPSEAVKILYGENQPIKVKVESSDIEVKNLEDLLNIVELASTEDVYQHVRRGGLARWLYVIGDKPLSREINRLRNAVTRFNVKDMLKKILEERVKFLKELASLLDAAKRRSR